MHGWKVDKGTTIHIGCRTFNASSRKDFPPSTQVTIRKFPEQKTELTIGRKHCAPDVCWFSFTIIQSVSAVCLGSTDKGDKALSFQFGLDISQEKTSTTAMPVPTMVSPQPNFENESIRTPTSLNPDIFQKYRSTTNIVEPDLLSQASETINAN